MHICIFSQFKVLVFGLPLSTCPGRQQCLFEAHPCAIAKCIVVAGYGCSDDASSGWNGDRTRIFCRFRVHKNTHIVFFINANRVCALRHPLSWFPSRPDRSTVDKFYTLRQLVPCFQRYWVLMPGTNNASLAGDVLNVPQCQWTAHVIADAVHRENLSLVRN